MESFSFLTQKQPARGFTLVEMLVVLAIIVIITTIALVGQSNFNKSLILTETAYNVALSIRESQSYGLSTRTFGGIQNAGYGVRFSLASPTTYTTFSDVHPAAPGTDTPRCPGHSERNASNPEARPGNCYYSNASELIRTYTLARGYRITSFCGTTAGGTQTCSGWTLTNLDIVFLRPNTETIITGNNATQAFTKASIIIQPPEGGAERCITVTSLGAISVAAECI